jgi:hypothetical protein
MKPENKTIKDSKFVKYQKVKDRYDVFNHKGEYLGEIGYYTKWKCWIWEQSPNVIMSTECLESVVNNMKELDKI